MTVLPYPSYLRVYEPVDALDPELRRHLHDDLDGIQPSGATLAGEQRTALSRTVGVGTIAVEADHPAAYVMRRDDQTLVCPVDMSLRSWLSLSALVESVGDVTASLLFPAQTIATPDEQFLDWRRAHPQAVPHIRQTTWGVPRTWFVLVVEDERETYDAGGTPSVRYRASTLDARRRIGQAHAVLCKVIDEEELLEELAELGTWLESFDRASWVELDYAGVAHLLGGALGEDRSARDIHRALHALRRGDLAGAGAAYGAFVERWRRVSAYERAN